LFTNPDSRVGINSGAFLGDGNDFALSVNVCIPLCLFLLFESRRKLARIVWGAGVLALVLCVVATKSRGGTLALGAIGIYYWLRSERKVMMAALATVTVIIVLATAPPLWFERMGTITDTEESSAQGRITAWKAGVEMAIGSPLIGVGPGHFAMAYGRAKMARWLTAHSVYFLLLGELGFPGLILLLVFIGSNLLANRSMLNEVGRLSPDDAATASNLLSSTSASLVGFAVGGAFLSAAYYPHLYVLSGLLVAARQVVRLHLEARQSAGREHPAAVATAVARRPVRSGEISPEWKPSPTYRIGDLGRDRA
jgi:probable O-glycosylation ligase (exosortase A-associated)